MIRTSAVSGEGMDEWLAWIGHGLDAARGRRQETDAAIRQRVAELERQLAAK